VSRKRSSTSLGQVSIMNTDRLNRFRLRTIAALGSALQFWAAAVARTPRPVFIAPAGPPLLRNHGTRWKYGQCGSTAMVERWNNWNRGVSSSGGGVSCYDASGAIATTAKTCTLASDCRQAVRPACCGAVLEVGLAKASSCTFPTPSARILPAPSTSHLPLPAGAGRGWQGCGPGGSIGVECVSGQCMTFVMAVAWTQQQMRPAVRRAQRWGR